MTWNKRSTVGDRIILEQAEARELYRNWEWSKNRELIRARLDRAEKIYGSGAKERIRTYMAQMREGQLL